MTTPQTFAGKMTQGDAPDWEPLLRLAGMEITGSFMWMYDVTMDDGRMVQAYKHYWTRRYVFLDAVGRAYRWMGDGRYTLTPAFEALHAIIDQDDRENLPMPHPYRRPVASAAPDE